MKKTLLLGAAASAAIFSTAVLALPFQAQTNQKGSLIWYPRVETGGQATCTWTPSNPAWTVNPELYFVGSWQCDVDDWTTSTFIQLTNDRDNSDVNIKCYYMDGKKNESDFTFVMSHNEAKIWDVASGRTTRSGGRAFPGTTAQRKNVIIEDPNQLGETPPEYPAACQGQPYCAPSNLPEESEIDVHWSGELFCFAYYPGDQAPYSYNFLTGKATVVHSGEDTDDNYYAYDYGPYSFFAHVPDGKGTITKGDLTLKGRDQGKFGYYDDCGQFTLVQYIPRGLSLEDEFDYNYPEVIANQLTLASCWQDVRKAKQKVYRGVIIDAWDYNERGLTSREGCVDSWTEMYLTGDIFDDYDVLDGDIEVEKASGLSAAYARVYTPLTYAENYDSCAGSGVVPADGIIGGANGTAAYSGFIGLHTTFYSMGGLTPFDFYNPVDAAEAVSATTLTHSGRAFGSIKYDSTAGGGNP